MAYPPIDRRVAAATRYRAQRPGVAQKDDAYDGVYQ